MNFTCPSFMLDLSHHTVWHIYSSTSLQHLLLCSSLRLQDCVLHSIPFHLTFVYAFIIRIFLPYVNFAIKYILVSCCFLSEPDIVSECWGCVCNVCSSQVSSQFDPNESHIYIPINLLDSMETYNYTQTPDYRLAPMLCLLVRHYAFKSIQ